LEKKWEAEFEKVSRLSEVFDHLLHRAELGQMNHQGGSTANAAEETAQFTKIPMAWMLDEQKDLTLCVGLNAKLCGNFEARGILKKLGISQKVVNGVAVDGTSSKRIHHCEDVMLNKCPDLYGQIFDVYTDWQEEVCGKPISLWDETDRIITKEFRTAALYRYDKDGVVTSSYGAFLFVILLLWWSVMFAELRGVWEWLAVLPTYPEDEDGNWTDDTNDEQILVNSMPRMHKFLIIVCCVIPRTIISVKLSMAGTFFLIEADSYGDLILNAVALAFLIEADELIYTAVASQQLKEAMGSVKPLQKTFWFSSNFDRPVGGILTFLLIGIAFGFVADAYASEKGKFVLGASLACLCHSEGVPCINAQVLGGIANMHWTNAKITSYTHHAGHQFRIFLVVLLLALVVYVAVMRMKSMTANDATEMTLLDTDDDTEAGDNESVY
jgi:hypothetical protein